LSIKIRVAEISNLMPLLVCNCTLVEANKKVNKIKDKHKYKVQLSLAACKVGHCG
jgi:hypothetical protein